MIQIGFCARFFRLKRSIKVLLVLLSLFFLIFFQASLFQLLKLEIHCEDHISPSYISAVHI